MPDITMCEGKDCPLKSDCYRYTATPSEWHQSYFIHPPYNHQDKTCESFWNNKKTKNENKKS
jgi:hypothetical protein